MAGYIIAPLDKVKGEGAWPEFNEIRKNVEQAVVSRAQTLWPGFPAGGIMPTGNQYGLGPFRKNDMAGDTADATTSGSYSFTKTVAATGWQDLLRYTVRKDEVHGFVGFAVTEPTLRFTQFRMEIGDHIMPIIDLHEALLYERFAIVLKTDKGKELIADPNTRVLVRGYARSLGDQTFVPLGLNAYKVKDIMIVET